MPCFLDDTTLSTQPILYSLCYAIIHEGETLNSGHYQCLLSTERGQYLSNDGVGAKPAKGATIQWAERNCYVLCLKRVQ